MQHFVHFVKKLRVLLPSFVLLFTVLFTTGMHAQATAKDYDKFIQGKWQVSGFFRAPESMPQKEARVYLNMLVTIKPDRIHLPTFDIFKPEFKSSPIVLSKYLKQFRSIPADLSLKDENCWITEITGLGADKTKKNISILTLRSGTLVLVWKGVYFMMDRVSR